MASVSVCCPSCSATEGVMRNQRWLFYAYDRIRRVVVAHVFGERTLATLERLLSLLSAFEVVVWMTDG